MLRIIVPRTSVCPVAVTVLGIPTAWKTPCASNEPGVRSIKNKTIPKNFDFISYLFLKCADVCPSSHKTGFRAGERRRLAGRLYITPRTEIQTPRGLAHVCSEIFQSVAKVFT